jgi:hypothetical protein
VSSVKSVKRQAALFCRRYITSSSQAHKLTNSQAHKLTNSQTHKVSYLFIHPTVRLQESANKVEKVQ